MKKVGNKGEFVEKEGNNFKMKKVKEKSLVCWVDLKGNKYHTSTFQPITKEEEREILNDKRKRIKTKE